MLLEDYMDTIRFAARGGLMPVQPEEWIDELKAEAARQSLESVR